MEKLRSRKAEVGEQLDRSRAATRFEAPPPAGRGRRRRAAPRRDARRPSPAPPDRPPAEPAPGLAPDGPKPDQPESYTNRLLKAKQKVWEEREKDKDKTP